MRQLKITKRITPRDSYALSLYLKELAKEDVLTPEEELELIRRAKEGDQEAYDRLIRANLRFVISVAKQYAHKDIPLSDLISEGNLGLIRAIQSFDETRGFKFISYAVWWIRQAILNLLAQYGDVVSVPNYRKVSTSTIVETDAQVEQEQEGNITPEAVAEVLDIPADVVAHILANQRTVSFDRPVEGDEEQTPAKVVADENQNVLSEVEKKSLREVLQRLLKHLTPRERFIIQHYYGLDGEGAWSMRQIADYLNLSTERVRQLHKQALRKIRHLIGRSKVKVL